MLPQAAGAARFVCRVVPDDPCIARSVTQLRTEWLRSSPTLSSTCTRLHPPVLVEWIGGSALVVHRLPHLVERSKPARSRGPSGVVGDVDHHGLEGRALVAEIARATEMEAKFGVSTGRDEYRACDHRAFLDRQAVAVPDITEQVAHRVSDHLTREWAGAGSSGEKARGQCSAAIEQFVGCGRGWLCHARASVTLGWLCVLGLHLTSQGYPSVMAIGKAKPRTDEIIIDAAEDCFAVVGVRGTTVDDIAAAAGVSRITVYRRVGNRDQIVLAVLVRVTERYLARLQPRLLAQPTVADATVLLVRSTVRAARRDDLSLLFASEERGATGAPIPEAVGPLSERFGESLAFIADRLPGSLAAGVAPAEAGEWILRVIVSLATTEPASPRSEAETDRWVRRFVLPGLVGCRPAATAQRGAMI